MTAYAKPNYNTAVKSGATGYKPNNGYVSGNMNYGVGAPSAQIVQLTFSAAPTDLSTLQIPDGINGSGTPTRTFTFTYGGSPGSGIIPLVGGGGTAAQAATAAQVALAAQLTTWTVTNPSSGVLLLVRKQRGFSLTSAQQAAFRSDSTHIALAQTLAVFASVLPGRFGKNYCILPG